jgi:hypothetical protein
MEPLLGDVVGARGVSLPGKGAETHALVPSSPLCPARRCPQQRWRCCPCALVAAREGRKGAVRVGSGLGGEGSGTQRPHELRPSLALQERGLFASDRRHEREEVLAHQWAPQIKHDNLQLERAGHLLEPVSNTLLIAHSRRAVQTSADAAELPPLTATSSYKKKKKKKK